MRPDERELYWAIFQVTDQLKQATSVAYRIEEVTKLDLDDTLSRLPLLNVE
jgi:hypothetical protein